MFSSLLMPIEAYEELHINLAMPLAIPKTTNVEGMAGMHDMSIEEAVTHTFTAEHKPSLQNRRRLNNTFTGGSRRR